MNNELGDDIGELEYTKLSKGALLRMEKKKKEEEEHKKRMATMKKKKTSKAAARPRFDREKLASGFMNNAKQAKDEVNGWALDFEN